MKWPQVTEALVSGMGQLRDPGVQAAGMAPEEPGTMAPWHPEKP